MKAEHLLGTAARPASPLAPRAQTTRSTMPLGEFELIAKYFARPARRVTLGVGDDCALLAPQPGMQLAVSMDTLVEGRHFLPGIDPRVLGRLALAVNLSDLAACGAQPLAFMLSLTLPQVDEPFLAGLSAGLFALAERHGIDLMGGNTTSGPLNIAITVFGEVPQEVALLRSGARPGDDLWVSGTLGDARLGVEALRGQVDLSEPALAQARQAMEMPQPRVSLGLALRGIATSAIDLSDGLMGDLGHVLRASGRGAPLGATLDVDAIPRSALLAVQPRDCQHLCLLAGGGDYELLFTSPPARRDAVKAAAGSAGVPIKRIGHVEMPAGVRVHDGRGTAVVGPWHSFDHFRAE
jgi:thiamine-monophosphate kinase